MKDFVGRWKGHPRIVPAAAPHAPYTCSKETLLAARDFALAEGIPLLIHVSETNKEVHDARAAWQGQSPFVHLATIGFLERADGRRVPIGGPRRVDGQERRRHRAPVRRGPLQPERT
jgi:cytosine/adenosine deaminase-related metal-dependent hydrolase